MGKRWSRGEFCWYELGTTDTAAAKNFYGALFGWTSTDIPMGEMGTYTLFQKDGQDIAGLFKLEGPMFEGVPPNWMAYVAVENILADTSHAKELGGKVVTDVMDVPNVGKMSVVSDPQGAILSLFQAGNHEGTGRWEGAPNSFCWSELCSPDPAGSKAFYTKLFGWTAKPSSIPGMEYNEWCLGERPIGGCYKPGPEMGPMPPHWMNYIAVTDCDGTASRAKALGATLMVPPTDIPHVGRFSCLCDPQGAAIAVIKLG